MAVDARTRLTQGDEGTSYGTGWRPVSVTDEPVHPITQAWWWSRALLAWVSPLMALGHQKQLDAEDVWPLQPALQAAHVTARFRAYFDHHQSALRAFRQVFGWRFVVTGVAFLVSMIVGLLGPVVLERVVSMLSMPDVVYPTTVSWVALLFVSKVVGAVINNYANLDSEVIAIEFVGALKTLVYEKSLRLSTEARQQRTVGDITNLFTSDAEYILSAAFFVHQAWLIPLQVTCVSLMLWRLLGWASLAGISVIVFMSWLNKIFSRRMFHSQRKYRRSKDDRMKKITEVFKSIAIIKFNAWENKFMERISASRSAELQDLFYVRVWTCLSIVLVWGMPVFISATTFGVFTLVMERELTPALAFSSIALFQLIQGSLRRVTNIITMLIQAKVALERIMEFLLLPEIDDQDILTAAHPQARKYVDEKAVLAVESASFGWNPSTSILRDVNLKMYPGEFYVVHGPVGCGKSSLCSALLGEMSKQSGTLYLGGSIAYCSQQAWIQNMTIRDNILFGLPYDRKKYEKVIEACALKTDVKSFPGGDLTEIGERGVNVSGGQKARIALARACYSDASIYVLDSPLAAVDAIVQNEIFQKCLIGLLRQKTIILVTHNPEIITSPHVTHRITIDEDGRLIETSAEAGIRPTTGGHCSPLPAHSFSLVSAQGNGSSSNCTELPDFDEDPMLNEDSALASPFSNNEVRLMSPRVDHVSESKQTAKGKLVVEEERSEGRVGGHVFMAYFRAAGGMTVVVLVLSSQVIWQTLQISSDFWLGHWSSDSAEPDAHSTTASYRLTIYALLGLGAAVMVLVRTLAATIYGLRASKHLFDQMTLALLHAPMRFFDVNPIGRILTRYGSDVSAVDTNIPFMFSTLMAQLFSVGFSAATAAIVVQWKGFLLLPVVYLYYRFGSFYIEPARELQRLVKTSSAPVLNHLSETVDGGSIVRAYGPTQLNRFKKTHMDRLDDNNKVWFAQLCVSQWFSVRIQLLGAAFVLVITTSLLVLRHQLGAAVIGLAFSYALKVSDNLEKIVQVLSRIETMMVSPERLQEYIDIPQEPAHRVPQIDRFLAESAWPHAGEIIFDDVCFRYKENDQLVLKNLSFEIHGGEKIGIVGRTGAGKSSLTMALFRINELASGTIWIDNIDIQSIGLNQLRQRLSIIPQNPVLFKGMLRNYLDPFDEFPDDELWASIRQVGLHDRISNEPLQLCLVVEENGENFSVGERQMLCMARALLRQSRIVIFDEATAAIDHETDQKLQGVIRDAFSTSTVLTIAHRLDTILDADRVLVLDHGTVVDFASPHILVEKQYGHFYDLMKEGGYLDSFYTT